MYKLVMFLWFLFIVGKWIVIWVMTRAQKKEIAAKAVPISPNPQIDSIEIILDMEDAIIDEFNSAFPQMLLIERPLGGSKYLQDYDSDYFKLLKALRALSQMPYVLSEEQAKLVQRSLQMNEIEAMFQADKEKLLRPEEVKLYTQAQQDLHDTHLDFLGAYKHVYYYERRIEIYEAKLKQSNNQKQEEWNKRLAEYQEEYEKYHEQLSVAFSRKNDAKKVLQDYLLKLLNTLIDPSEINDTTLETQLSNFNRYSELVYNPLPRKKEEAMVTRNTATS